MNANAQLLKGTDENSATSQSDWHWLRWGLPAASVIVVIALYYVCENWRGKREWKRYERQLSDQGHALQWEAYIPPPPGGKPETLVAAMIDARLRSSKWRLGVAV